MTSERTRRICYCMSWGMLCALVCTLVVPTLTFAVEPNRTVTVAVKDRVGTMLPDAIVNIRDAAGAPIKATALGDGTFYITNAQAGKATLEVDHPLQGSGTVEVVLPDQKVIGITITLENSVLVADVFNPDTPPARLPTPDIGNVFTGFRGTVCPVGGNGDLCFTAISATDGSVIGDLGDNTASGASDSCGFNNTIDEWYCYVATCDGTATVTTCNPGTTFDTILSAFDACAGLELACNDDTVGAPAACSLGGLNRFSTISFPVLTGVSYLVRVTAFNDDFAGSGGFGTTYEIGFSCSAGGGGGGNVCVGGETQENEPNCGLGLGGLGDDTVNGGCNSFPTVFSPISCGETYCSSTAVIVDRDTDWYAFTVVGSDTEITFTATSTSGLVIGFVDTNDCATASALDPFAVLLPGDTASITRCFPPGTWWAFAGGDFGNPGPCPSEYSATLTCGAACAPPPTPCDDPNSGDCFSDNGTPGCNDPVCCNIVCAIDPFCCDVAWDGICAGEAADLCGGGGVPANDLCVDAIPVGVPSTTAGTTVNATTDSEAPFCGVSPTSPGVWYTVVGTGNTMTASLCNGVATYDSKLTVYCGDCTDFVCVDGNDDACGLQSEVSWCSQAGATYMILVHGFGGDNGPFELVVSDDGTPCTASVICLAIGACCMPAPDCSCQDDFTQADCEALGGVYQGDGSSCSGTFQGYSVAAGTSAFEDISGTGSMAPTASTSDDGGDVVPLGFTFNFFGDDHTDVGIGSNGYLTFGSDLSDFSNDTIPDSNDPNDLIAPLWDDFNPSSGGTVHYQTLGAAPNRRFIAQWTDVPQFGNSDANTFQAVLFEGSNVVEYRYGTFTPESFADDYTVGVENQDGSAGTSVAAATLVPGDSLVFTPSSGQGIQCDTTPPVITCPADMTVECDGAGNTGMLNAWLASASATDDCGAVTVTNDFTGLSDGCGATGSALVTWTATDAAGNTSLCAATFTIVDTMPPTITCSASNGNESSDDSGGMIGGTPGLQGGRPGATGGLTDLPGGGAIGGLPDGGMGGGGQTPVSSPNNLLTIAFDATDMCGDVTISAVMDISCNQVQFGCLQIPLTNGQQIKLKCDEEHCTFNTNSNGILDVKAGTAVMIVTATDECGNTAMCSVDLCDAASGPSGP